MPSQAGNSGVSGIGEASRPCLCSNPHVQSPRSVCRSLNDRSRRVLLKQLLTGNVFGELDQERVALPRVVWAIYRSVR